MTLTERERLRRVLAGEPVDRPSVICPGGMMTMACREVMQSCGCCWPEVHRNPARMATLSEAMRSESGLENVGIPFCMTVEAEAWGGEVEDGDECTEPCIVDYPLKALEDWRSLKALDPSRDGRLPVIVECTRLLRAQLPDTVVVGNLVGPISIATSLLEAAMLYKALVKQPAEAQALLSFLTESSVAYGQALMDAGADVIVIADPSSTGEILGPRSFARFAAPCLNRMADSAHERGVGVIVHICGDVSSVFDQLDALHADCISFDSNVGLRQAREALPSKKIMGNLSTMLLQLGPEDRIRASARRLLENGVDILAPACGISAKTPLAHLRAMTETAKSYAASAKAHESAVKVHESNAGLP